MPRPKLVLDEEQIRQLAAINCSLPEIAAVMRCDVKTLTSRFSQVIKEGRGQGNVSLKRLMWKKAHEGNVTMMIWLSKNQCGYSDKQELTTGKTIRPTIIHHPNGSATELSYEPVEETNTEDDSDE